MNLWHTPPSSSSSGALTGSREPVSCSRSSLTNAHLSIKYTYLYSLYILSEHKMFFTAFPNILDVIYSSSLFLCVALPTQFQGQPPSPTFPVSPSHSTRVLLVPSAPSLLSTVEFFPPFLISVVTPGCIHLTIWSEGSPIRENTWCVSLWVLVTLMEKGNQ